ncbi:short chain enoyl-CoA hydratase /Enoyl-CoA hydratase [Noviherbaspirillum humi]|uniref:Short chain enoyl-CoA hydratase /Enoyl-CoA hydratase n=1 Tax=Noviherbaspirillum humi TaxID=1688639 RepID=A0A239H3J0_9BURK|nr:enoyl-CoA hydratase [Noviherbaspirillum humi]SNS75725.1 short chain enoyl-CoA hydratase /Enoyl-CoA hydratase [Noviherbaspirillum humi]
MSAELQASRRDATLILTISNPGAKNALHPDMYAAAVETLTTAERDDSIRAVVLTGADHFFCAGGNLNRLLENRSKDKSVQEASLDNLRGWIEAIRDCPKPVIAAVDGAAAGAGFSLALACDLVVAGASAKFVMAYVKVGLTPDGGGSWFLSRALPRQLAMEIMVEGKPIGAERLHQLGLVNRLVPDGSALDQALEWADALAELSPNAVERIKSLSHEALNTSLPQHFEVEKTHFVESLHHADAQEGISAFLEKRKPRYK